MAATRSASLWGSCVGAVRGRTEELELHSLYTLRGPGQTHVSTSTSRATSSLIVRANGRSHDVSHVTDAEHSFGRSWTQRRGIEREEATEIAGLAAVLSDFLRLVSGRRDVGAKGVYDLLITAGTTIRRPIRRFRGGRACND